MTYGQDAQCVVAAQISSDRWSSSRRPLPLHVFAAIRVLQVIDKPLGPFEDTHLDHVLDTRAQDHHLDSLPVGRASSCFGSFGCDSFGEFCSVSNEHVLGPSLLRVKWVCLVDYVSRAGGNEGRKTYQAPTQYSAAETRNSNSSIGVGLLCTAVGSETLFDRFVDTEVDCATDDVTSQVKIEACPESEDTPTLDYLLDGTIAANATMFLW